MFRIKNALIVILMGSMILSCIDNRQDILSESNDGGSDYSDPDPLTEEEALTAPKAPSSLFVIANVDGEIRSFQANAPDNYSVIVRDASTAAYFEEFELSDDGNHLLYVNSDGDLVLLDLNSPNNRLVIQENVSCSEIQFIDNDRLQYSHIGNIYCYTISEPAGKYIMVNNSELFCNHGATVSPDGSKIVFKNQDPGQTDNAIYAWAEVTGGTVTSCTQLGTTEDIALLELLDFIWIDDNNTIFMKPAAGLNTRVKAYTINGTIQFDANVTLNNSVVDYTSLNISGDRSKLCVYGSFGCYQVDLLHLDFGTQIEVNEIYKSEIIKTVFADYSKDSKYLLVSTDRCIGIYEAETMRQTDFNSRDIISEGERLYYLCCN